MIKADVALAAARKEFDDATKSAERARAYANSTDERAWVALNAYRAALAAFWEKKPKAAGVKP